jgi:4-hydroxy-2-oxoheptanedioate aldolase
MLSNPVKDKLKQGQPTVGVLNNIASTQLTEIFAIAGFDFVIFDLEHSTISEETLEHLVRASKLKGMVPMVRVRDNDQRLIMGVLDAGCLGVMIPQIETEEEARRAVHTTKYRPLGGRGVNWNTVAGEWGSLDPAQYLEAANEQILTMLQIETAKGFQNVDAIVKVPGIDVLLFGPSDLSASMGHPGNPRHPDVLAAIETMAQTARKAGVAVGGYGTMDRNAMEELQRKGYLHFVVGAGAMIMDTSRKTVAGMKSTFLS